MLHYIYVRSPYFYILPISLIFVTVSVVLNLPSLLFIVSFFFLYFVPQFRLFHFPLCQVLYMQIQL